MSNKANKRSMLVCAITLLLCVSMVVGSTYAWFSDAVTVSDNVIESGELKMTMSYSDSLNGTWTDAKTATAPIFNYDKWEPGYTVVKYVKVGNVGDLAFRYRLNFTPNSTVSGAYELADVIDVYYVVEPTADITTRAQVANMTYAGTLSDVIDNEGTLNKVLMPKETDTVAIALKMQESAGNEYQNLSIGGGFDLELVAVQYTSEEDSFGNDYDAEAWNAVYTANELKEALAKGGYIVLGADITLTEMMIVGKDTTLSMMKGASLTATSPYMFYVENADLTVKNGTYVNTNNTGVDTAIFAVIGDSQVTIEDGDFNGGTGANSVNAVVWTYAGDPTVTIKNGNFTTGVDAGGNAGTIIYVELGTVNIEGGNFSNSGKYYWNKNWMMNAADAAYAAGTAKINVTGGTYSFDVSTENVELGVVAAGYSAMNNGDGTWTVVYGNAVNTVAAANAAMAASSENVVLYNTTEPSSVVEIPASYTGTLTLLNVTVKSVQATADADIVIEGKVVVNANGDGIAVASESTGVSAITANGTLNISGIGTLTAIASGDHAYGIGASGATVSIRDITIDYVEGGHAYGVGSDTKYYKDAPEGAPAIGGAVVTLDKVTVNKAIGGSKAAGIGAIYWNGTSVTITNSTIKYVEGGVSAAGIGGSRVSDGATEAECVTIQIVDSSITAKGGVYGAGIGSGYDTHCQPNQPVCTVKISGNSVINATGGKYAAGVGTGYHNAGLDGEIASTVTVNAASGEKFYKDSYTLAQDVGFGVVDVSREGKGNNCSINYKGTEIGITLSVKSDDELKTALENGVTNIYLADGSYTMISTGNDVTITGTKDTKIALPFGQLSGNKNTITFDGVTVYGEAESSWYSTLFNGAKKVIYKNCTIYDQLTTYCDSEFINCTIYNDFENDYSVYCYGGKNISFTGCTFNATNGKAIKVYDEGNGGRTVNVTGCTFTAVNYKKAAVEIDSTYSTYYLYIEDCKLEGAFTALWNSDAGEDAGTNVCVDGTWVKGSAPAAN